MEGGLGQALFLVASALSLEATLAPRHLPMQVTKNMGPWY